MHLEPVDSRLEPQASNAKGTGGTETVAEASLSTDSVTSRTMYYSLIDEKTEWNIRVMNRVVHVFHELIVHRFTK